MASPADRKNQQVLDALEKDNHKQALQLCMQRQKRGERGDHLKALKAYVLTCSTSSNLKAQGYSETKKLIGKQPPIVEVQILRLLQQALMAAQDLHVGRSPVQVKDDISQLWDRAVKARPGDEDLAKECLFFYFEQGEWEGAQKVSPTVPEAQKKLFGSLAYKMISKAAAEVPQDPKNLMSPGRSIQTPQELSLLIEIYCRQSYHAEALAILNSPNLGIKSAVAKGDWSFVLVKLDIMETLELWTEQWDYCKELLDAASVDIGRDANQEDVLQPHEQGDDWRVWMALISASRRINTAETYKATEDFVQSFATIRPKSRNARIAMLEVLSPETDHNAGCQINERKYLEECQRYFLDTASMSYCCDDLEWYVEMLSEDSLEEFLELKDKIIPPPDVSDKDGTTVSISSHITGLKLDFVLRISVGGHRNQREKLEKYIVRCLKIYEMTLPTGSAPDPTGEHLGDDACLLAVMALVHLWNLENRENEDQSSSKSLVQAAAVLDFLLCRSKHNHQALLYLPADRNPHTGLSWLLKLYEKSLTQVPDNAKTALEKGNFAQIERFWEFGDKLCDSICRYMFKLEKRRIARLCPSKAGGLEHKDVEPLAPLPSQLSDNRDYRVLVNYEKSTDTPFEQHLRSASKPARYWLEAFTMIETLYITITSPSETLSGIPQDPKTLAECLKEILLMESIGQELTQAELSHVELQVAIAETLSGLNDNLASTSWQKISQGLEEIQLWLQINLDNMDKQGGDENTNGFTSSGPGAIPTWEFVHESFLCLDGLKFLIALLRAVTSQSSKRSGGGGGGGSVNHKDSIGKTTAKVDELVEQLYKACRLRANEIKDGLSESGVVGTFVDLLLERDTNENGEAEILSETNDTQDQEQRQQGTVGKALEDLIGEPQLEMFGSRMVESWQDTVDGILRVKLD
ncbi:MAG: hypothetical protein M1837_006795 [Sclerophora amabilis]|nr:MAG: hypothetical protein M1837_006795 [Sclerophora amabilis]